MLAGDLATMPLHDLLQWAEASRVSGVVTVERDGLTSWLRIRDRSALATALPPGPTTPNAPGAPAAGDTAHAAEVAEERLLDLFLGSGGRFHFSVGYDERDAGIPIQLPLRMLVMDGLRILDEWPRLDQAYPDDSARLEALPGAQRPRSGLSLRVLRCAELGRSLSESRFALGISRPALIRRVDGLRAAGLLAVQGATAAVDPLSKLLAQASILLRERQFDEASMVLSSLLATDPGDVRIRRLLRDAEATQVASLYEALDPLSRVELLDPALLSSRRLGNADREIAGRINGSWDVAALVLSSPLRELETLKSLTKLERLGMIRLIHR